MLLCQTIKHNVSFPSAPDDYEVKLEPNSSGGILGKLRGKLTILTFTLTENPSKLNIK